MSSLSFSRLAAIFGLWVAYRYFAWFEESSKLTKAVPPGPTPRFLVNNLFDLPRKNMSQVFISWAQKYNSSILLASIRPLDPDGSASPRALRVIYIIPAGLLLLGLTVGH